MANGDGAGIRLNKPVTYTDSNGYTKAAVITGTRSSIAEGTNVSRPEKGNAHLRILHPTDKTRDYVRENVPQGEGPRTFSVA